MNNYILLFWKKFGLMSFAVGITGLILSLGFYYPARGKQENSKQLTVNNQQKTIEATTSTTSTSILTIPLSTSTENAEKRSPSPQPTLTTIAPPTTAISHSATLQISQVGTYKVDLEGVQTAFDQLLKTGNENNFSVEYQMYSFGPMVTGIGGIKAHDNWYWALYYNGKYSQVGAGDLMVNEGDIITWRMETW